MGLDDLKGPDVVDLSTDPPSSMSLHSHDSPSRSGGGSLPRWAGRRPPSLEDYDALDVNFDLSGFHRGRVGHGPGLGGFARRTLDSFRRDPRRTVSHTSDTARVFDAAQAARETARAPLSRHLRGRHLQMIAFGGSIGTGLFVGSGKALQVGGPAAVVIAFSLIGAMMFCTMHALGELAVAFPVAGSFSAFSTRFLDPAWGFAMGWNYALMWLVVLPLETVAASIVIDYWHTGISNAVWVTFVLVIVVTINLFGVKGYGEAEFVLSIIKVVAIVGFM